MEQAKAFKNLYNNGNLNVPLFMPFYLAPILYSAADSRPNEHRTKTTVLNDIGPIKAVAGQRRAAEGARTSPKVSGLISNMHLIS